LGTDTRIDGVNGLDTVNVTNNGSLSQILGPLDIRSFGGRTALTIDDSADVTGKFATLDNVYGDGFITGLPPAKITWSGHDLSSLTIRGGAVNAGFVGNVFVVKDTPLNDLGIKTNLYTGSGSVGDLVLVEGTSGALAINGQNGPDGVLLGNVSGGLDQIKG